MQNAIGKKLVLELPRRISHRKILRSSGYKDELTWGAAWAYRATGNFTYLTLAKKLYQDYGIGKQPLGMRFSWDDKKVGAQVLLTKNFTTYLFFQ